MSTPAALEALTLATHHYENFPVAPWFLPRVYREPIAMIYAFARQADDLADEGILSPTDRLAALSSMRQELITPTQPFFDHLRSLISAHQLSLHHFTDLLSAFEQDVTTPRYETFDAVLDYCNRSANPIGRLLLELMKQNTPQHQLLGDALCTGLQLVNFVQDLDSDWNIRQRLYVPLEWLHAHHLTPEALFTPSEAAQAVVVRFLDAAQASVRQGAHLGHHLPGRLGAYLRAISGGGLLMAHRLKKRTHVCQRPTLSWLDRALILLCTIKPYHARWFIPETTHV